MYTILKGIFDFVFGSQLLQSVIDSTIGFRFNGWFLGIVGYRGLHMVREGDSCLIAGIYSELTIQSFSKAVGISGQVIVVEANPENVIRLTKACHSLKNVVILNNALWRDKGEMESLMSSKEKDQGYNRLSSNELQEFPEHIDDNPQTVKVSTDTISNIINDSEVRKVDHINLTVNGAELQVVENVNTILRDHPGVRIYINSEVPDPAESTIEMLRKSGMKVYLSRWIRTVNKKISLVRIYAIG